MGGCRAGCRASAMRQTGRDRVGGHIFVKRGLATPPLLASLQAAASAGILVQQRSLAAEQLQALLLRDTCLVIALVDKLTLGGAGRAAVAAGACSDGAAVLGSGNADGVRRSCRIAMGAAAPVACGGEAASSTGEQQVGSPSCSSCPPPVAQEEAAGGGTGDRGGRACGYLGHYIVLCGYDAARECYEIRDPAAASRQAEQSRAVGQGTGSGAALWGGALRCDWRHACKMC